MITLADRILVLHGFRFAGEIVNDHRYETTSAAIMSPSMRCRMPRQDREPRAKTPSLSRKPIRFTSIIYKVLREHLLDGSLPKGLVFGEAGVARAFGSSRIPGRGGAAASERRGLAGAPKFAATWADCGRTRPSWSCRELTDAGFRATRKRSRAISTRAAISSASIRRSSTRWLQRWLRTILSKRKRARRTLRSQPDSRA